MVVGIRLEVWGDFAAFNRPEMKVERVSYEVMTPAAARGVLEAIYWKPQVKWEVDEIRVLRPIRFAHVRRNEVSARVAVRGAAGAEAAMKGSPAVLGLAVDDTAVREQRAALVLRDVRYGIGARIRVLDERERDGTVPSHPEAKHLDCFRRRAARGQYFHHPYLGTREFPAEFMLVEEFSPCPAELLGERDLGLMLHDVDFLDDAHGTVVESSAGRRVTARPRFFHARLMNGVLRIPATEPEAR